MSTTLVNVAEEVDRARKKLPPEFQGSIILANHLLLKISYNSFAVRDYAYELICKCLQAKGIDSSRLIIGEQSDFKPDFKEGEEGTPLKSGEVRTLHINKKPYIAIY